MKIRESGMPDQVMWEGFFDVKSILSIMRIDHSVNDIADIGCGYGTFSIAAAKIVQGKVYAIDIDPAMIKETKTEAAKLHLDNIETVLRDFADDGTGLKSESVDYVMLFNILHAEEPEKLLQEAYRILKPKGRLGIIHWRFDASTPRGPSIDIRPRPEQCITWAKNAGFNSPRQHALPPYHYGIVLEKPSAYVADWNI